MTGADGRLVDWPPRPKNGHNNDIIIIIVSLYLKFQYLQELN